jgi:hypothetical protein
MLALRTEADTEVRQAHFDREPQYDPDSHRDGFPAWPQPLFVIMEFAAQRQTRYI